VVLSETLCMCENISPASDPVLVSMACQIHGSLSHCNSFIRSLQPMYHHHHHGGKLDSLYLSASKERQPIWEDRGPPARIQTIPIAVVGDAFKLLGDQGTRNLLWPSVVLWENRRIVSLQVLRTHTGNNEWTFGVRARCQCVRS